MSKFAIILIGLFFAVLVGTGMAADVSVKLSGPGAVNDSTIKAGQNVFVDVYWSNDKPRRGFTAGLKIISEDIKNVVHVTDTAGGLNENGDVKGYNGWEDRSVFDITGVKVPNVDWDGVLPDVLGFGGAVAKKVWEPHESQKCLSFEMIVADAGTIVIDSAFWKPAGYWKFGSGEKPVWKGPYAFKVVK